MVKRFVITFLVFLLGSVACHRDKAIQLSAMLTANLPLKNTVKQAPTTPTSSPAETPIPPKYTPTALPPLSGSSGGVIAFQSDRDRQDEICVMNADGSDQRLLISNQWSLDSMPAWSPNGTQIVFASRHRGKDFEISLVFVAEDLIGIKGEILKLTDNDFDDLYPTWSPDGRQIAFRSNRSDQVDIYIIHVDGSSILQQLTFNREIDQDRAPAWRPNNPNLPDEDDL